LDEAKSACARQAPLGRQFTYPLQKVKDRLLGANRDTEHEG
jgi:hypothetical protein